VAFEHTLTVRFDEIDRAGIVYFADLLKYCHIAYEELLAQVMGDIEGFFDTSGWGMPLVHTEADFKGPSKLGDRLRIALDVERLGPSSITFAYTIRCGDELRATAKLVHAFVDMTRFKAIRAPEPFVAGLERLGLLPENKAGNHD
jgi:1,4-dihydroxy-2-naphthoyl-CoA hydrolase